MRRDLPYSLSDGSADPEPDRFADHALPNPRPNHDAHVHADHPLPHPPPYKSALPNDSTDEAANNRSAFTPAHPHPHERAVGMVAVLPLRLTHLEAHLGLEQNASDPTAH